MAGMLPSYPVFDTDQELSSLPQKWEDWVSGLEDLMSSLAIIDHQRKWSMLRFYGGEKLRKLETQLAYNKVDPFGADPAAVPPIPGTLDHYRRLKESLTAHFAPCVNEVYSRFRFRSINQDEGESVDTFITRVRAEAAHCNFHQDEHDRQIRDQIVFGCRSGKLRRKALAEDLPLDRLIQTARAEESAKANAAEMERVGDSDTTADVFKLSRPGKYSNKQSFNAKSKSCGTDNSPPNPPVSDRKCFNCGGPFPHSNAKPCPARGKTCNKCQKQNHFASQCRGGRKVVSAVDEQENSDVEDQFLSHLGEVKNVGALSAQPHLVTIQSTEGDIRFTPDTGADVTLIDSATFSKLRPKPPLTKSGIKLLAYGSTKPLEILGSYVATLQFNDKEIRERIYVSHNFNKGISLLSRSASQGLGLVTLHFGTQVGQASLLNPEGAETHPLLSSFPDICEGVGCHKNLEISLPLKEGAKHIVAPPSRIPVNLYPKVKAEIERLEKAGVFESVPVDDNTQSVSRLVPVPKPIEGSEEVGVRITFDWRNLNENLDPVHHSTPTIEELKARLINAKVFSQVDMKDAFYQLPLDEESRKLTTFSTPWGLKRSTRLIQGARPSSAICHETIRRDLEGITGALNIADNILVWGCGDTEEDAVKEHDKALNDVFLMFRRNGLTINPKKSVFSATRTKFFGYVFSADGVAPDQDKVAALRGASPPSSKEDVRSFLGMAGFNSQFIPGYATLSAPLRSLTKKGVNFKWGAAEKESFRAITQSISDNTLLAYFDTNRPTALFTDASPVGVNATLAQLDSEGRYRPVNIASRALTATEMLYDQLEREAVAMHFGCTRFKIFLQGCHFTHFIDPEPLKHMMEKTKREAPARIERIRLKLQGFDSSIQLVKGKHNPADYLSRHPLPYSSCSKAEKECFADVRNHIFVVAQMLPEALTVTRVREAIGRDSILKKVIQLLGSGTRTCPAKDSSLAPFRPVWSELSLGAGLLFRGERVVLPQSLVKDAIRLAHEGHMGIQKTKQYLRSTLWFPKMDSLTEAAISQCIPCQAVTPCSRREPLQMTPLPAEPWQLVAADIFGPLPSGEKILVLKCLRSKWPEVCIFLRNQATNAEGVISAMEKLFSIHGIPDIIRTDNGPPFNSKTYKDFSRRFGFQTQKVTPLWPEANGQAEAFMKCLGKVIRTAHIENKDWKSALNSFLMAYRATPHPSTGMAPASLLYPGRRFRTLLPSYPAAGKAEEDVQRFNERAMARSKAFQDSKRRTKPSSLGLGDTVLVRQQKRNKLTSYYNPDPFKIVAVKGSMITAARNGQKIVRNSSFFKKIPAEMVSVPSVPAPVRPSVSARLAVPPRLPAVLPVPPTAVFCFPPSSLGGQQGVRDIPVPVLPPPHPVLPDPVLPVPDSDDEFIDAEEPVPEQDIVLNPDLAAVAPDAAAIVPAAHGPPIAAFRPQLDEPLAQEPFELPRNIRPMPYNLRERKD